MVNGQCSQFIAFVIKETKHILRDKRTMLILFGMPVVMMLLFGFAITTDVKNVRTVVVTSEMSPRTQQAVERLAQSEYHHADCEHPTGSRTTHPQSEGRYGAGVCTESWHANHG